jgi:hypothetical protein
MFQYHISFGKKSVSVHRATRIGDLKASFRQEIVDSSSAASHPQNNLIFLFPANSAGMSYEEHFDFFFGHRFVFEQGIG